MQLAFLSWRISRSRSWIEEGNTACCSLIERLTWDPSSHEDTINLAVRSFRHDPMTGRKINSPRSNRRSNDDLIFFQQDSRSWRQFCFDFTVRRAPAHPFLYSVTYMVDDAFIREILALSRFIHQTPFMTKDESSMAKRRCASSSCLPFPCVWYLWINRRNSVMPFYAFHHSISTCKTCETYAQ